MVGSQDQRRGVGDNIVEVRQVEGQGVVEFGAGVGLVCAYEFRHLLSLVYSRAQFKFRNLDGSRVKSLLT